jgi:hypothetical protein
VNRARTYHLILFVSLAALLLTGCARELAEPTSVPTPIPLTSTPTQIPPTSTPTPIPPTPTPIPPTPTAKPIPFAIQGKEFEGEFDSHKIYCTNPVNAEIHLGSNGELYFLVGGQMQIPLRGSGFVLWCYGAEHTWIDKATYAGYTFASDKDNPLLFRVDKNAGYLYISGKGIVTMPDGKKVTLPRY